MKPGVKVLINEFRRNTAVFRIDYFLINQSYNASNFTAWCFIVLISITPAASYWLQRDVTDLMSWFTLQLGRALNKHTSDCLKQIFTIASHQRRVRTGDGEITTAHMISIWQRFSHSGKTSCIFATKSVQTFDTVHVLLLWVWHWTTTFIKLLKTLYNA